MRVNATWIVLGVGLIPLGYLYFKLEFLSRHPWLVLFLSALYLLILWLVSEIVGRVVNRFRRDIDRK